ncbi:Speckle-type POZ protein [Hordeum vulgare]|nr:Speckle-type POZ protein [Hordeum vulgare]
MQIVVCIDDIWKTKCVLGSWFVDDRYGFLLRRLSRGGASDLEFDGVSGVLPRSDSFNDKGFTFDEPPWKYAKLHINDGAMSSSDPASSEKENRFGVVNPRSAGSPRSAARIPSGHRPNAPTSPPCRTPRNAVASQPEDPLVKKGGRPAVRRASFARRPPPAAAGKQGRREVEGGGG